MNADLETLSSQVSGRVTSIDFFRGFTMFLLAGEATRLYGHLMDINCSAVQFIGNQFHHHE